MLSFRTTRKRLGKVCVQQRILKGWGKRKNKLVYIRASSYQQSTKQTRLYAGGEISKHLFFSTSTSGKPQGERRESPEEAYTVKMHTHVTLEFRLNTQLFLGFLFVCWQNCKTVFWEKWGSWPSPPLLQTLATEGRSVYTARTQTKVLIFSPKLFPNCL